MRRSGNRSAVFMRLAPIFALALVLVGCSELWGPLNDPSDPKASNYQGYPTVATSAEIRPVSPADAGTLAGASMTIAKVVDATAYELMLATSTLMTSPILDKSNYASNVMNLTGAILADSTTYYWKAKAKEASGSWGTWSAVASFTAKFPAAATPTFSPAGGIYSTNQSVTIICTTPNSTIYYTTDGVTTPTTSSTQYTGTAITVVVNPATTLKAIAVAPFYSQSGISSAAYYSSFAMVSIPAGSFNNGTSTVTLSAFRMSKYDITQSKYQAIMGYNPSSFSGNSDAATCPVEWVTWFDAVEFCNKLSTADGLTPVYSITGRTPASGYPITSATVSPTWTNSGYRLPTEAQWEYAARAGTTTTYYWGNDSSDATVGQYAWYGTNSSSKTHAVGQKLPNAWGLYDMAGNVWQWCWDWWGTYPGGAQTDPMGAASGADRVGRGGSWLYGASSCTVSLRSNNDPNYQSINVGFRVVRP